MYVRYRVVVPGPWRDRCVEAESMRRDRVVLVVVLGALLVLQAVAGARWESLGNVVFLIACLAVGVVLLVARGVRGRKASDES